MTTLLGIDLGTTGLKVTLLAENGQLIGSEYCEYPILTPQAGYAEHRVASELEGIAPVVEHPAKVLHAAGIATEKIVQGRPLVPCLREIR